MSPGRAAPAMRAIVGDRVDRLAVDLEQDRAALDLGVERGAERLDARDQHAARLPRQLEAVERRRIEIAHRQAERPAPVRSRPARPAPPAGRRGPAAARRAAPPASP